MGYDVIVVGARVAGASTAMLLARAGLRVLAVEQARFPSDTLSTHQLQCPGVARLARWGLLDRVLASGVPPVRTVQFHAAGSVLTGSYPPVEATDFMISPRRTVLDALLVDAAREAGAEVREATVLTELSTQDGRVTGVRCRAKGAATDTTERATIVIGADGRRSRVAKQVGAREYRTRPSGSVAFYTYWDGLPVEGGEMHAFEGGVAAAFPTNENLTITYVAAPAGEFDAFRRDPEARLLASLDQAGTLGKRARAATRTGPVRGTADLPNLFRTPYGRGWALAGDAGLAMDPITGLGMGHALRDAELLSAAVVAGLDQHGRLDRELAAYHRQRDRDTKAIYDFTIGLSRFRPVAAADRTLFGAIAADPVAVEGFLGALNGSTPIDRFFSPRNLVRLVGLRTFLQLARRRPG